MFRKIPFRTMFPHFPSKVQNLTEFLNYLHDSNSIFRAAGIYSDIFFGSTVFFLMNTLVFFGLPGINSEVSGRTVSKCQDFLETSRCELLFATRSWWNSWLKCQQSLFSSSRPLTFQFLVVVGDSQIFKVFTQNRIQQRRSFPSRSLIFPFR